MFMVSYAQKLFSHCNVLSEYPGSMPPETTIDMISYKF